MLTRTTMDHEPVPFISSLAHHAADPFRLLVEAVVDYAIFMLDPAGRVASWNPGALHGGAEVLADARLEVLEAGVSFLQKPFTMAALTHKVRQVLGRTV